jgi:hypothetical protein
LVKINAGKNRFLDMCQAAQAIATILALIIGGVWGLKIYYSTREAFHKADISHKVEFVQITDKKVLARISVIVTNSGKGSLTLDSGIIRVSQVLPLANCMDIKELPCPKHRIERNENPVPEGDETDKIALWPSIIDNIKLAYTYLEPTEKTANYADIILPINVEVIQVYSYFPNPDIDNIGWKTITLHKKFYMDGKDGK